MNKRKTDPTRIAGAEAIEKKGWLKAYKWLILRRLSQLGILALFLLGPWFGIWIVKGKFPDMGIRLPRIWAPFLNSGQIVEQSLREAV